MRRSRPITSYSTYTCVFVALAGLLFGMGGTLHWSGASETRAKNSLEPQPGEAGQPEPRQTGPGQRDLTQGDPGQTDRGQRDPRYGNTPEFLRLDSEADREAFRRWFTSIAEYEALRPSTEIPTEIDDCAALLRYAYRGALHSHTESWFRETGLEGLAFLPPVRKYSYPHTQLGAALFRVHPASPDERLRDAFAEFADAKTLLQLNASFVARDVRLALPGDLLFYPQREQNSPYHSMVFVGRRQLENDGSGDSILVYHTGPIGKSRGEMRRVRLNELLQHPSPRWRPAEGNSNFLGVYRWNILR